MQLQNKRDYILYEWEDEKHKVYYFADILL